MLFIGHIENKRAAQALSDYLSLQKIEHQVESEQVESSQSLIPRYNFYVASTQAHVAQHLFNEFIANPNQEKFLAASWQVGKVTKGQKANLGLSRIWAVTGPITKFITLLCVFVYIASLAGYFGWIRTNFYYGWQASEIYRLVTPAFIHFSVLHILFNLCWWWYLGGRVEKILGKQTLITVLILSAIVSNTAQALLVNGNFGGLSGVNYALAGFVWYCGTIYKSKSLMLPNNIFIFLVVWLLLGFVEVLPISMANWAHLFGLLSGLMLARLLVKPEPQNNLV